MTNLECIVGILAGHREARRWADEAVAHDLLAQLGLDAADVAKNAAPVVDPALVTEAEVVAAETAAKEATEKAEAVRHALDAQAEADVVDEPAKAEDHEPLLPAEPVPPHA